MQHMKRFAVNSPRGLRLTEAIDNEAYTLLNINGKSYVVRTIEPSNCRRVYNHILD